MGQNVALETDNARCHPASGNSSTSAILDISFVDGLGENLEDMAIVEAVVNLAHTLGLRIIAEGIETTGQLDQLRALGCELGQGYYFSRPLPAHKASTLLLASLSHRSERRQAVRGLRTVYRRSKILHETTGSTKRGNLLGQLRSNTGCLSKYRLQSFPTSHMLKVG